MKITIVTPSFNQGAFLEATITSVLNQSYPSVEYIVLDGGSTDGSAEIIKRHAARLAHWSSGPDGGQAAAIRKGFELGTGEILCWLNSDDLLLPDALTRVAAYFEAHPDAEAVSGGAYLITAEGSLYNRFKCNYTLGVRATHSRFVIYGQEGVYQQATFWRRSAYDAVGGIDPTFRFAMDLDLFARLARRRRFGRIPHVLACFRLHNESKTSRLADVHDIEVKRIRDIYLGAHPLYRLEYLLAMYYRGASKLRRAALVFQQRTVADAVAAGLRELRAAPLMTE